METFNEWRRADDMNDNVSVHLSLTLINSSAFLNILSIFSPFEWDSFALQLIVKKRNFFFEG
jgi:hypothetical protein